MSFSIAASGLARAAAWSESTEEAPGGRDWACPRGMEEKTSGSDRTRAKQKTFRVMKPPLPGIHSLPLLPKARSRGFSSQLSRGIADRDSRCRAASHDRVAGAL